MKSPYAALCEAERQAFLAAPPDYLCRTLSDVSGRCNLRGAGSSWTVSGLSGRC